MASLLPLYLKGDTLALYIEMEEDDQKQIGLAERGVHWWCIRSVQESNYDQVDVYANKGDRPERGFLSLGNAWQETSLGVGLLRKIVAGKKEFIGRSYENCHFQRRNLAVHLLLRRQQHSNSTWNWFHVFSYERLFLLLTRHTIQPLFFYSAYNVNCGLQVGFLSLKKFLQK